MSDQMLYAALGILFFGIAKDGPRSLWDSVFYGLAGTGFVVASVVEWFS